MSRKALFSLVANFEVTCTLDLGMKEWIYRDVTSIYSLKSWKWPGRFSYGLGMRLQPPRLENGMRSKYSTTTI